MKHIIISCTIPITFTFSLKLISELKKAGNKITLVSSEEDKLRELANNLGVDYHYVPFYRGINPLKDLKAIRILYKLLKRLNPDILIGATPKAAMVSMIAGKMAGISKRIYHIYGLPYETAKGLKLKVLLTIERLTGACANLIVPIGSSVKASTLGHKLFPESKMRQTGLLTVGGVDTQRFDSDSLRQEGINLRKELGISQSDIVIGYVARLTYDKGFCDLIDIWNRIKHINNIHLLIVGDSDTRVPVSADTLDKFFSQERVYHLGFRKDVEKCFSAMDIFLFPSHREGFGNVSIEASAMRIPVITYDVTGCKDAVENNISGYVVPFRDYDSIEQIILSLYNNYELRERLGEQGRNRVLDNFTLKKVAENFIKTIEL